jgi:hypothetical protein
MGTSVIQDLRRLCVKLRNIEHGSKADVELHNLSKYDLGDINVLIATLRHVLSDSSVQKLSPGRCRCGKFPLPEPEPATRWEGVTRHAMVACTSIFPCAL